MGNVMQQLHWLCDCKAFDTKTFSNELKRNSYDFQTSRKLLKIDLLIEQQEALSTPNTLTSHSLILISSLFFHISLIL